MCLCDEQAAQASHNSIPISKEHIRQVTETSPGKHSMQDFFHQMSDSKPLLDVELVEASVQAPACTILVQKEACSLPESL